MTLMTQISRSSPRILSVIPPMTQLNTPYPSTAYLTGFLRSRKIEAVQEDLALALVPWSWWLLFRTRFGLRLRAVGENPQMVDAAGVSVTRLRYAALTLNGVLCGLAGSYLVLAQSASFSPNMTAGRGFMALAALIFGRWYPVGALWACLLFGFLDAAAIRMQGVHFPLIGEVPVQAIQALPYVLTVVLLAGFIGKAVAPQALGRPYSKDR